MTVQAPSEQLFLSRKPTIALNCRMTFAVAGLWFLHSSQRGGGPPYGRTPSAQTKNETVYPAAPARSALSFPHRHDAHRRTDHRDRHFRPGVVSGPLRADFRGVEKKSPHPPSPKPTLRRLFSGFVRTPYWQGFGRWHVASTPAASEVPGRDMIPRFWNALPPEDFATGPRPAALR